MTAPRTEEWTLIETTLFREVTDDFSAARLDSRQRSGHVRNRVTGGGPHEVWCERWHRAEPEAPHLHAYGPVSHRPSGDLCATFQFLPVPHPIEPTGATSTYEVEFHLGIHENEASRNQSPVLVGVGERLKGAHRTTDGRAVVWLKPLDECDYIGVIHSGEVGRESALEVLPVGSHRELDIFLGASPQGAESRRRHKRPGNVINGAAEVVNDLSDLDTDLDGKRGNFRDYQRVGRRATIRLGAQLTCDSVSGWIHFTPDALYERVVLLLGVLDFEASPVQSPHKAPPPNGSR